MKALRILLSFVLLAPVAFAQTSDHGLGAFSNDKGDIKLAVDAAVASRDLSSPYVMFVVFMAANDKGHGLVVGREDVTLVHQGREFKMPTLRALRKDYGGIIRDIALYRHLGKEGIASSWIRFYEFPYDSDFFPPLAPRARLKMDEGSMTGFHGFVTKCYFKNPGFKKGDKIAIRVVAKNAPDVQGEVAVVL
jgi:hypothetical protein